MTQGIRPIRVEGDIAFVPLTKGFEAVIDAADAPLVAAWNWHAKVGTHTVYAIRTVRLGNGKKGRFHMHRVIMAAPGDLQVDHIDSDGLNCRRTNMRLATRSQNMHNQRISRVNTSGVKGVYWDKAEAKWHAQIKLDGKTRNLGLFPTIEAASAAAADARAALHGEFGRTA